MSARTRSTRARALATATVALTLLGTVSACGGSSGKASATNSPQGSANGQKMTLILGQQGDPFYTTMQCGAQAEAGKLGIKLSVQAGQTWGVPVQTPIVQAAVAAGPKAIIAVPNDPDAMYAPLAQAKARGIKVLAADTTLTNDDILSSQISSDNEKAGRGAADIIATLIGGSGQIAINGLTPGATTLTLREKGIQEELKAKYPDITIADTESTPNGLSDATTKATAILARFPHLKGVIGLSAVAAQGSGAAVKTAGKTAVKVVGFDAGPAQIQQLRDGTVDAVIAQRPYQIGQDAIDQASNATTGKPVTAKIGTGFSTITAADVDTPAGKAAAYRSSC